MEYLKRLYDLLGVIIEDDRKAIDKNMVNFYKFGSEYYSAEEIGAICHEIVHSNEYRQLDDIKFKKKFTMRSNKLQRMLY